MLDIVNSYNIFIDTERNLSPDSTGDSVNLPLGESPITAGSNQIIKLNLMELTVPKTWYNVNSTNNKFRIQDGNASTTELTGQCVVGNFETPRKMLNQSFCPQVLSTFLALPTLAGSTAGGSSFVINNPPVGATIDTNTNVLDFTMTIDVACPYASTADCPIFKFYVRDGKCFQLVGGKRITSEPTIPPVGFQDMCFECYAVDASGTNPFTISYRAYYNAQTATENYCYVRINEQNTNTETSSLNSFNQDTRRTSMTGSNILGIVPINDDYCRYIAQTDNVFFTTILAKQVAQMRVKITDSLGEPFPLINPGQNVVGNRFFTCVIRVDIIQLHPSIPHSLHNPNLDEKTQARFSTEPANQIGIVANVGKNGPQSGFYGNGFYNFQGKQIS